jgi:hypothetical protein
MERSNQTRDSSRNANFLMTDDFRPLPTFGANLWRAMRNLFGGILAIELSASRRKDPMRE